MTVKSLVIKYGVRHNIIEYLIRLIDKHGLGILRTTKNKYYSPSQKEAIINLVLLNNESIVSVAIEKSHRSDSKIKTNYYIYALP